MNEMVEVRLGHFNSTPQWWQNFIQATRVDGGFTHAQIYEVVHSLGVEYNKWDDTLEYATLKFPAAVYTLFVLRWS